MNATLAHLLTRLYPRLWRDRYGEEFEALLQSSPGGMRASVNVVCSAISEHANPTLGHTMNQPTGSLAAITRQPSAFLPVAMSFTALTMVLADVALHGIVPKTDEGAVAHLWQLLMAGQMPVVAFFAIKSLRRAPTQTVQVLALQAGAVLANLAAVFFLNLG